MQKLQHTAPDVRPVHKCILVTGDGNTFLLDIHAEHTYTHNVVNIIVTTNGHGSVEACVAYPNNSDTAPLASA